jgi:hypothetical protein
MVHVAHQRGVLATHSQQLADANVADEIVPPSMCPRLQLGRVAGMQTGAEEAARDDAPCCMKPLSNWKATRFANQTLGAAELARLIKSPKFARLTVNNV